jgi:hypothetical protein
MTSQGSVFNRRHRGQFSAVVDTAAREGRPAAAPRGRFMMPRTCPWVLRPAQGRRGLRQGPPGSPEYLQALIACRIRLGRRGRSL